MRVQMVMIRNVIRDSQSTIALGSDLGLGTMPSCLATSTGGKPPTLCGNRDIQQPPLLECSPLLIFHPVPHITQGILLTWRVLCRLEFLGRGILRLVLQSHSNVAGHVLRHIPHEARSDKRRQCECHSCEVEESRLSSQSSDLVSSKGTTDR